MAPNITIVKHNPLPFSTWKPIIQQLQKCYSKIVFLHHFERSPLPNTPSTNNERKSSNPLFVHFSLSRFRYRNTQPPDRPEVSFKTTNEFSQTVKKVTKGSWKKSENLSILASHIRTIPPTLLSVRSYLKLFRFD